jgi:predicted acetyltransferase
MHRLMGEARLLYGFARPFGTLITIGTGMAPNLALPVQSDSWWAKNPLVNAFKTVQVGYEIMQLATSCEPAHLAAADLVDADAYQRFNIGERWVEKIYNINGRTFEAENWKDLDVSLNDYKKMSDIVSLTEEYLIKEKERIDKVTKKLTPPRK